MCITSQQTYIFISECCAHILAYKNALRGGGSRPTISEKYFRSTYIRHHANLDYTRITMTRPSVWVVFTVQSCDAGLFKLKRAYYTNQKHIAAYARAKRDVLHARMQWKGMVNLYKCSMFVITETQLVLNAISEHLWSFHSFIPSVHAYHVSLSPYLSI